MTEPKVQEPHYNFVISTTQVASIIGLFWMDGKLSEQSAKQLLSTFTEYARSHKAPTL